MRSGMMILGIPDILFEGGDELASSKETMD